MDNITNEKIFELLEKLSETRESEIRERAQMIENQKALIEGQKEILIRLSHIEQTQNIHATEIGINIAKIEQQEKNLDKHISETKDSIGEKIDNKLLEFENHLLKNKMKSSWAIITSIGAFIVGGAQFLYYYMVLKK